MSKDYRDVFDQLFPGSDPRSLKGLSRGRLIELLVSNKPPPDVSPGTVTVDDPSPLSDEAEVLERFQPMPDGENSTLGDEDDDLADDVNALSLSVKGAPSYVGISSVGAALRVIEWLRPGSLPRKPPTSHDDQSHQHEEKTQDVQPEEVSANSASSHWEEVPLINAYFEFVHPAIPLIDESSFRNTYMAAKRKDPRWSLLLNVVLAMASVVAGPVAESSSHWMYFAKASAHLTFETLNHAHYEIIQALAILSGLYMHVLQRPTEANAIMGATLRLAIILGFHKDFPETTTQKSTSSINAEMRRRIWWSLCMLDSWATNGLGRPTMGRISTGVTVKLPQEGIEKSPALLQLVQQNIYLTILSTRVEDALAASPILNEENTLAMDQQYADWFNSSFVKRGGQLHRERLGVHVMANVMRWRYLWHRAIIHRPYLLWSLTCKQRPEQLPEERQRAISLCSQHCQELIEDIAATWDERKACQFAGWNATWFIYQASFTPLLTLFYKFSDPETIRDSQRQIELVLDTLGHLQPWFATAQRSAEVVRWLYAASQCQSNNGGTSITSGPGPGNSLEGADIHADVQTAGSGGILPDNAVAVGLESFESAFPPPFSDDFLGALGWTTEWDAMLDVDIPGLDFGMDPDV
ncbi:hypothetical protein H2204_009369 [Knufia peltigerae]|uniref:Xylanolytic transcriptional activator regulatory domain-containing protein n=1 Tax=Knufia peltigerae TaxID=1002370 RepID=A0AA39CV60_9EURO|nr:hypothetical protein H2204_009369 [Knufia peltigerae]